MVKKTKLFNMFFIVLVALLLTVTGCKLSDKTTDTGGTTPPPAATDTPTSLFATAGHSDDTSEAFRHWDEDDPPLVSASCARCHSNGGFVDYIADGVVSGPAEPGAFTCTLCHESSSGGAVRAVDTVTFDSGAVIGGLGSEALCMQCHQGRSSKPSVDKYLAGKSNDTVYTSLSFRNIHYFAAAATLYGKFAQGGYEYPGMMYDGWNTHVENYDRCVACHDPHSLEIKTEECAHCHSGVSSSGVTLASTGVHDIRYYGSMIDYDGDGDYTEGIYYELTDIAAHLYNAMWSYAKNVTGRAIGYEAHTYPYFFYDTNEDGVINETEAVSSNGYRMFTPRLLKATYNYQVFQKDPGGFAHGGKYMIQLLYDSLMDINGANPAPIPLPFMRRDDEGHFNGASEAFRHWDGEGVQAGCAKCHGYNGLADFIEHGENEETRVPNGMLCTNCHSELPPNRDNVRKQPEGVKFPSGAMLTMNDNSNLCLNCHQGRASKNSIDYKIAGSAGPYSFTNIHYYPTAAVLFGSEAQGGYEYPFKSYNGRRQFINHNGLYDTCVECHMGTKGENFIIGHNVQKPNPADCVICHGRDPSQPTPGWEPANFHFDGIRPGSTPDYDGDGNMNESVKDEIAGLEAALYAQMLKESKALGRPLYYNDHSYPYFFQDTNGNGIGDPGESGRYSFTANLLKAAYNYQLSKKEPNGWVHNSLYVAQLLVDSIADLHGDVSAYTWR